MKRTTVAVVAGVALIIAGWVTSATLHAQGAPVPPAAPDETLTRDEQGNPTWRATRIDTPITLDGRLDEEIYRTVKPASGFVQQEPQEGQPATEETEAWFFFDNRNVYVAGRCWDSHPEREVANELRRDTLNISQNENFVIVLDTFHDKRNGFYFQTNPLGAIRDQTITDEGNPNQDWNTVWDVKVGRFEHGWTLEMVIPFKSLRYSGSGPQTWGVNIRRIVRWKNETSMLAKVPASFALLGIYKLSFAGTLVGLETPAQSMNLEVKPYAISTVASNRTNVSTDKLDGDAGFDVKYGLSRSLIADFTYNTDFAQVEDDVQQVNLTRFSLFYPEKRDFFLEGQGIFLFGLLPQGMANVSTGDVPSLFFSRQIGLSQGEAVPVRVGARLTGKANAYTIGALNIQTGDQPSAGAVTTNFSVVRLKRDILRRSSIGMIATRRSPPIGRSGSNYSFGVDSAIFVGSNIGISTYYARTETPGREGNDSSYRAEFDYNADRYGLNLEHLAVGDDFNPEIGFVSRSNFRRSSANARFSPRPRRGTNRWIRRVAWTGSFDYVTNGRTSTLESRAAQAGFRIEESNSDMWNIVDYSRTYEFLPAPFRISPGVVIPVGGYAFQTVRTSYSLGQQRRLSGRISAARGSFYTGDRTDLGYSGRVEVTPRLGLEPSVTINWVKLPQGNFTTRLVSTRIVFTPGPRSVVSGLLQYNALSHTVSSNVRYRWEYRPGSELFMVYSDARDTGRTGFPDLQNRTVALKVTRLVRF